MHIKHYKHIPALLLFSFLFIPMLYSLIHENFLGSFLLQVANTEELTLAVVFKLEPKLVRAGKYNWHHAGPSEDCLRKSSELCYSIGFADTAASVPARKKGFWV